MIRKPLLPPSRRSRTLYTAASPRQPPPDAMRPGSVPSRAQRAARRRCWPASAPLTARRVRSGRQGGAITTTGADSRLSWRTLSRALASARLSPPGTAFLALFREKNH
jgi:hypothetical protein